MNTALSYAFAVTTVVALMIGQILFKRAANAIGGESLSNALKNQEAVMSFLVACAIYAVATVLWVLALRQLPLSRAYMLMAAGFVLVPVLSHFVYAEPLSARFFVGAGLIVAGVLITNSS